MIDWLKLEAVPKADVASWRLEYGLSDGAEYSEDVRGARSSPPEPDTGFCFSWYRGDDEISSTVNNFRMVVERHATSSPSPHFRKVNGLHFIVLYDAEISLEAAVSLVEDYPPGSGGDIDACPAISVSEICKACESVNACLDDEILGDTLKFYCIVVVLNNGKVIGPDAWSRSQLELL
ncbi:MAG: hypothetical protein MJA29_14585, partial [Candidatus Omnitrophica bacterium]|nr:hypothetical protein [Candidatus Omnitrophota bacterium]